MCGPYKVSRRTTLSPRNGRSGIVLLVVLGMLTLFSILAVSYLVFTTKQRAAAFNISRVESSRVDATRLLDDALTGILVGANGPSSSLWGHDLLGDLYGMRDGIVGEVTIPNDYVTNSLDIAPEVLLDGSFLRFPSELFRAATFPYGRSQVDLLRVYPPASSVFATDDELTGRLLTFTAGPLAGKTVSIARYFGDHRGTTNNRAHLSGQIVVDLREHRSSILTIDGESKSLAEWITQWSATPTTSGPHRLIYDAPITTLPHAPAATAAPYGTFYINGRILNGPGLGWDLTRSSIATTTGTEFNLNEVIATTLNSAAVQRGIAGTPIAGKLFAAPSSPGGFGADMAVALQGHHALYRLAPNASTSISADQQFLQDLPPGDTDEPYDAPDYNNLWLSYFPDNAVLGQSAPSFVRPALLNWIINQQSGTLGSLPPSRLRSMIHAIQRSTLRPLPFAYGGSANAYIPASPADRGAGVLRLSYAQFTGSNEKVGFNAPINVNMDITDTDPAAPAYSTYLAARIQDLARALAGRDDNGDGFVDSWDVDNNGDGHVDSVWVDSGHPISQSADGRLVKPLVSYLIEDMGGRVNANLAGNVAQARNVIGTAMSGALQQSSPTPAPGSSAATSPVQIGGTQYGVTNMPNGFGYGPAEIDVRAIFGDLYAGAAATRLTRGPQALIRNRTNLQTIGGVDYSAAGELHDTATGTGNDIRGMLRNPTRPNLHNLLHPQGLPVDAFGRTSVGIGVDGGLLVSRASVAVANAGQAAGDADDDPYEFRLDVAGNQPDNPYTFDDLEGVLRFDELDRELLGSRLVEIINNYHSDPGSAPDQVEAIRRALAESITTHSNSAANLIGTMSSEWRDNATVSTSAPAPQSHFARVLRVENATPPISSQLLNALLWQLVPEELRTGGKFDLNRPFGNGFDDDADGVIDDPVEVASGEVFLQRKAGTAAASTRWSTPLGDVTPAEPGRNSRALFARHLYVLAMFLTRDGTTPGTTPGSKFEFPIAPTATIVPLAPPYVLPPEDEYRALKLAQWAVNVVDFRDSDAIMTRFDYDPNPFDGWNIIDTPTKSYRTVWGMENPELTLEESLAIHDRRVRDTADDDGPAAKRIQGASGSASIGADTTPDQWRLPEGSLFLEIRSTRTPAAYVAPTSETDSTAKAPSYPQDLYVNNGTAAVPNWQLDLGAEAPDNNPVWRVAISKAHHLLTPSAEPQLSPDLLLQPEGSEAQLAAAAHSPPVVADRDTLTTQPEQPLFFGPLKDSTTDPTRGIDRVIWFTSRSPDSNNDGITDTWVPRDSAAPGKVYYNQDPAARYLAGGQYAVVGPRQTTYFGQLETHSTAGPTHDVTNRPLVTFAEYSSPQRIEILSNSVEHTNLANASTRPTVDVGGTASASIRPALGIVAASNAPLAWTGPAAARKIGVNISEPYEIVGANPVFTTPRTYYRAPTESLLDSGGYPLDTWKNYGTGAGALPDIPFDTQGYSELDRTLDPIEAQKTGTREFYKTAYLQRLADPTRNHHITDNPYITVDYLSLDLTVFNGSMNNGQSFDDATPPPAPPIPLWPDDKDESPYSSAPDERLATRYKTGQTIEDAAAVAPFANLIHSANTYPPKLTPAAAPATDIPYFPFDLSMAADANATGADRTAHSSTLGYLNHSFGPRWAQHTTANVAISPFVGIPYSKFGAGAIWLNRPFVSPGELMWVPTSSAGTFNSRFATAEAVPPGDDPYDDADNVWVAPTPPAIAGRMRYDFNRQFPHLWNYFSSNANDFSLSPNFWRMLEYVSTPPPFDFEVSFVSPDLNVFNGTFDPAFGGNFDYATFGAPGTVTGNPNTWTAAGSGTWDRSTGAWSGTSSVPNRFWTNDYVTESLRPPFSFQAGIYRNGLLNLNTLKSNMVYGALAYGFSTDAATPNERAVVIGRSLGGAKALGSPGDTATAGFGALRDAFLESRRGYSLTTVPAAPSGVLLGPGLNFNYPTEFAGVFATAHAADIAPDLGTATNLRREPIESTMLRKDNTALRPLLQRDPALGIEAARDPARSVTHQQLGMTRLSNLASGQSNVFAIWITVGLFEVDAATLTVGQELGQDRGQVKRYRSFHIIDRSVPVRYEPGQVNNVRAVVQHSRLVD